METIELKHPVSVGGVTVERLTLRRPKVKDLLAAEKGTPDRAAQEVRLFANLCEVSPATIEELDLADYRQLQVLAEGFTG